VNQSVSRTALSGPARAFAKALTALQLHPSHQIRKVALETLALLLARGMDSQLNKVTLSKVQEVDPRKQELLKQLYDKFVSDPELCSRFSGTSSSPSAAQRRGSSDRTDLHPSSLSTPRNGGSPLAKGGGHLALAPSASGPGALSSRGNGGNAPGALLGKETTEHMGMGDPGQTERERWAATGSLSMAPKKPLPTPDRVARVLTTACSDATKAARLKRELKIMRTAGLSRDLFSRAEVDLLREELEPHVTPALLELMFSKRGFPDWTRAASLLEGAVRA